MRVVFCAYDFMPEKLPMQPWLTVHRVAEGLVRRGHEVHVLTDTARPAELAGGEVHWVKSLRGSNARPVKDKLRDLSPDGLVMLPTPLNIATTSWLDGIANCRRVGFASYPFYGWNELWRAGQCLRWIDVREYMRHLIIPTPVLQKALRSRLDAVIVQSQTTRTRLEGLRGDPSRCHFVPPGIELEQWPLSSDETSASGQTHLLYLGAATTIRGFDIAVQAVARVMDSGVGFRVLARGADASALEEILKKVEQAGISARTQVEGGWIGRERLVEEIHAATAVLLPFVLVPAELPVTAMEVIACGTPVIGTRMDGLPSTIGSAGTVVEPASVAALAEAVDKLHRDASVRVAWREGCRHRRAEMMGWDKVAEGWEQVLAYG